ncbi:hypothetical protein [Fibrobacter sp.]|uniref:hypothetical protein n=1 Tax=Fibrobacter sp. TaxID=35828 RepID=UPI003862D70A
MSKPHIYSSYEIFHAENVGWGVDDHLRNNQFVKLSEYDEKVAELTGNQRLNFEMFFDEREDNRYLRQRVDQLERENAALVEQLRKAVEEQLPWIPCSLKIPERGEYVFVNGSKGVEVRCWDTMDDTDDYDGHPISWDAWFKETEVDGDPDFWIDFDAVKAWMPIPKDPEEPKKDEEQHV